MTSIHDLFRRRNRTASGSADLDSTTVTAPGPGGEDGAGDGSGLAGPDGSDEDGSGLAGPGGSDEGGSGSAASGPSDDGAAGRGSGAEASAAPVSGGRRPAGADPSPDSVGVSAAVVPRGGQPIPRQVSAAAPRPVRAARSGPFAPEPDDPDPPSLADPLGEAGSLGVAGSRGVAAESETVVRAEAVDVGAAGPSGARVAERSEGSRGQHERPATPVPDAAAQSVAQSVAQSPARPAEAGEWRGIVLITGTDTDVGKTVVTSAIAAAAQAAGLRVAVIKPGQTGTAGGGPTDIDLINRLAAPDTTRTLASYPDPLAPLAAAKVASLPPLELYEVVDAIRTEADKHDLVLVEGAGGLLVPMGVRPSGDPWTFADLATTLGVSTIVVARAGLGTLNHTALTLEALARRGVPAGVVLGTWPAEPELVHWANFSELVPHLIGALPDGAGAMDPGVFRRSAPGWLTPALYGVLDNWRVWADDIN
ncbi:MAG: dethiobiotin synthetase [Actinoplanes sp.]|nr:dethiobiotin synthetase [Actinoplanes sp.]